MKNQKIKAPKVLLEDVSKSKKGEYSFSSKQLLKAIEMGAKKKAIKNGLNTETYAREQLNENAHIAQKGDYFVLFLFYLL